MAKAVLRERFPKYGFKKWLIRNIQLDKTKKHLVQDRSKGYLNYFGNIVIRFCIPNDRQIHTILSICSVLMYV
mgnify:CR=1 FL=1